MEHRQSYQLGAALGALATIVAAKDLDRLHDALDRLPETLWDLQAACDFFALLCERTLCRPVIEVNERVCALTETIFELVKDLRQGYEMYPAIRGFLAAYTLETSTTRATRWPDNEQI